MTPQDTFELTPEQTQVALSKLLQEREAQSGVDRFLNAAAQQLGRLAVVALLTSLLFVKDYGGIAVGCALVGVLLGAAQLLQNNVEEVEEAVEGRAAAQRLGMRARLESQLQTLQGRTWYWILLVPLYAYLLVGQWIGWPRPWWLFVIGGAMFAKLFYDAIRVRMAERNYYSSLLDLEMSLKTQRDTGTTVLSHEQAQRLYDIEQRQTERHVAQAMQQPDDIPLSDVQDELWSSIQDANKARTGTTGSQ